MMNKLFYVVLICSSLSFLCWGCYEKTNEQNLSLAEQLIVDWEGSSRDDYQHFAYQIDSVLPLLGDSLFYYRGLLLKARVKMFLADNDSTLFLLHKVAEYCACGDTTDMDIRSLYGRMYNVRGNVMARISLMDSARNEFMRAYHWCFPTGRKLDLLTISMNLADAYVRDGKFDKSTFWYRKALAITDSLQYPDEKRFPIYYGLAQVSMELRDFERCDYYYNLAASYYDKMNVYEKHVYLNNRGNSYYYRQDYKKALACFKQVERLLTIRPEMEFERNLTYINLGETYLLLNQTDSASYYLNLCHDFFKRINNNTALYYIDTQLIELALVEGDLPLAKRRYQEAVTPAYIEPNMVHIRNRYLQHYFETVGDFKKAYEYQARNKFIDDSIRNERIKMKAAEIALRYQQDSILLKKELLINQKQNEVLRLNQWIYSGLSICLLLIAAGVIALLCWKRKRDELEWGMRTDIISLKLKAVRNCISPHFIFNVLNQAILTGKEGGEEKKLLGLTKLIRYNLLLTDHLTVTLREELDFLKTYLGLVDKSLQPDFNLFLKVDSTVDIEHFKIPAMLLQIPTENAVKHGLRMKEGVKKLWIEVQRQEDCVVMMVRDNGGGFNEVTTSSGTGTGLKVILQTIQLLNLYNRQPIRMQIHNVAVNEVEKGCEICFSIPLDYSYELKKRK